MIFLIKIFRDIILGVSFLCVSLQVTGNSLLKNDSDVKGLQVSLKKLTENQINITVTNAGKKNIRAYSHVEAGEKHYDYFEVEALTPDGERMYFNFTESRLKSAPVIVDLKPAGNFSHTIDLVQWSGRSTNKQSLKKAGFNNLPHGIKIRLKYFNQPCDNCSEYYKSIWTGYVYSDWIQF